ncbi:MAG: hypothetical protein FD177_1323 [Desulfovibrionaceae bacterium]|nr:MAG: hypothetical protein FD177_1323 [Desulfovibrionaceae bacterium]
MATFILIHGAFQGSWVWKTTADMLRYAGHNVLTPGLTGLGDRAHLLRKDLSLAHYVDDVVNAACFAHTGPAIFVGHSFSGLVATAAAARLEGLACGLIYVDALIPEPGKAFRDMAGTEFSMVLAAHVHDGWLVRPWPLPVFGVAGSVLAEDFAARLTSTPLAAFTDQYDFPHPDAGLPRAFIRCTRNQNPLIVAQAAKAREYGFDYLEIDSGHAPMITAPDLLADALARCAARMPLKPSAEVYSAYCNRGLFRTSPARSGQTLEAAP